MSSVERSLLFGLLAFQNSFIDRQQLLTAFTTWVTDKRQALPDLLIAQGAVSAELAELLNRLVERHIEVHQNDVLESLGAISSADEFVTAVRSLNDSELNASCYHICSNVESNDPFATQPGVRGSSRGSRYLIRRSLGQGGLGIVSVAYDTELNREVALKEIRIDRADEIEMRRKFVVEAEVTGNLEHPGIVPVYGLGCNDDGRPYYAMRLIRGDNLATRIRMFHANVRSGKEPFDGSELRSLLRRFLDVCEAVRYAHSRGVLHRDLKPGNIMLGRFGETLVVDWGLAKTENRSGGTDLQLEQDPLVPKLANSDATRYGAAVGTPSYAPPEQLQGVLSSIDERSDVYGLGAIFYEILCNSPPARGSTLQEITEYVLQARVQSPLSRDSRVPASLSAICMRALAINRDNRYQTVESLLMEIESWLDDRPIQAKPDSLPDRLARWLRKNRAAAASIALALTSISLVSVTAAIFNNNLRKAAQHAERKATEQQRIAVQERELAEKQRSLAEIYFLHAREAVDRFLVNINDADDSISPSFQAFRLKQLADATEYYEKFLQADDSREEICRQKASAHFQLANIQRILGDHEKSLNYAKLAAKVLVEHKNSGKAQSLQEELDLAEFEILQAGLLADIGQMDAGLSSIQAICEKLQSLEQSIPDQPRFLRVLATAYELKAKLLHAKLARFESAKSLDRASELREKLKQMEPSKENRLAYYRCLVIKANQLNETRDFAQAEKIYDDILNALETDPPTSTQTDFLGILATVEHHRGVMWAAQNDPKRAAGHFSKAVKSRESILRARLPPSEQQLLAKSLSDWAVTLAIARDSAQAQNAASRALAISEEIVEFHPTSTDYQLHLAECLTKLATTSTDEQSVPRLERAIGILKPLIVDERARAGAQLHLLAAINALASLHFKAKNYQAALRYHTEALNSISQFSLNRDEELQYQLVLANAHSLIGSDHSKLEQYVDAGKAYMEALERLRSLKAKRANDDNISSLLIAVLINLHLNYTHQNDPAKSESMLQEAEDHAQRLPEGKLKDSFLSKLKKLRAEVPPPGAMP